MDISEFAKRFPEKMKEVQDFVESDDIKDILGVEAVNHFKESFEKEGFTDKALQKWSDVKRRDPNSQWYGHSGQTGKFSEARTVAKILTGEAGELKSAITYRYAPNGVIVSDEKPYAAVHQFGLQAKVYGKKSFTMTARPFFGKSEVLINNINEKIKVVSGMSKIKF